MDEQEVQLEPTNEPIEATEGTEQQTEEGQEQQAQAPAPKPEPSIEEKIAALLDERLKPISQRFSKYDSELGQFRKLQSELARNRQNNTTPPPKSVSELTPEQDAATKELIKHYFDSLYGDKLQTFEQYIQSQQEREATVNVYQTAQQIAGADFEKLDPIMGSLFTKYQQAAQEGDNEAAQMVWEVKNTRSGLKALIAEAREELAKTQEAKAGQVQTSREERARRATTAVNGSKETGPQYSADNLPKDRKERMKVIDELLKGAAQ